MNRIVSLSSDLLMSSGKLRSISLSPSAIMDQLLQTDQHSDPDAGRTVPELIESRGFKAQSYDIPTPDGFILVLHRIINPHSERRGSDSRPILLGHGIAAHAGHWLINSNDGYLDPIIDENENETPINSDCDSDHRPTGNNLGFLLANMGYDVWLLNWRGNRYSNRHKKFSTEDPEYWNFTLDDFIEYDLPAFINFILEKTGKRTLGYIGMSQGSNVMFGLLSCKPSFNRKIKPFIALCPAVRINNAIRIPIPWFKSKIPVPHIIKLPCMRIFHFALMSTGHGPVLNFVDSLATMFSSGNVLQYYFDQLTYMLSSSFFDLDLDRSRMSVYTAQANFCLTKKNLAHLVQFIMYDEFAKFDYGEAGNEFLYGKRDPPEYDLRNITNRSVAMIYSKNDEWATVQDFQSIGATMRVPLLKDHLIPDPKWSHYDFYFGKNVGKLVNDPVIEILKQAEMIPDDDLVLECEY